MDSPTRHTCPPDGVWDKRLAHRARSAECVMRSEPDELVVMQVEIHNRKTPFTASFCFRLALVPAHHKSAWYEFDNKAYPLHVKNYMREFILIGQNEAILSYSYGHVS